HLFEHGVSVFGALHGREHVSGSHGAHANLGSEFERHGARQLDYSGFGGVVVGVVGIAHDAIGGCGLQNHTTAAFDRVVFHHVARGRLGDIENAGQIYGDHLVPFFGRVARGLFGEAENSVVLGG